MKKSTIEVAITGVMLIVLVILVTTRLGGKQREPKEGKPPSVSPDLKLLARIERLKAQAVKVDPAVRERQLQRASLPWGRDPFFAVPTDKPSENLVKPPLTCSGVANTEGQPVALINRMVVAEGETIGGYLVKEITESGVVLERAGKTYVLRVGEE